MKRYGCIGKKLIHSFSKEIHGQLADYEYELIELGEDEVEPFFRQKDFAAVNVTIPYKQTVMAYLDEVSEIAQRIGAVNTVVNRDGKLYGDNTDYHGMKALIGRAGIRLDGRKVLVLGSGGTAGTARVVASDLGAAEILTVSRRKTQQHITYEEAAQLHADAQVIINTTPAGMYPDCAGSPIDLAPFANLEGVVDVVYNPLATNLVLDARRRGICATGGLYMLVMQAVAAVERFLDTTVPETAARQAYAGVLSAKENIVLTGMPGSGKSTVGRLLDLSGFSFVDTDELIEKRCGCTIRQLIAEKGESYFRDVETEVIREVSREGGQIIATGGGAVLRAENVNCLRQNGRVFFLNAALDRLCPTDGRPLSDTAEKLAVLYARRMDVYKSAADVVVPDLATPEATAQYILQKERS